MLEITVNQIDSVGDADFFLIPDRTQEDAYDLMFLYDGILGTAYAFHCNKHDDACYGIILKEGVYLAPAAVKRTETLEEAIALII